MNDSFVAMRREEELRSLSLAGKNGAMDYKRRKNGIKEGQV